MARMRKQDCKILNFKSFIQRQEIPVAKSKAVKQKQNI